MIIKVKKLFILLPVLFCALLCGGCYTQFMTYQGEVLAGRDSTGANCGDCREVAPASDRREICVWERDMFGYPDLRCYNTNYSSSWVYFHNTPWWYRDSYGWYDTRGCPPYYYFDRISGICRYYSNTGYPPGNPGTGGGGGGGIYNEPPQRRSSRIAQPPVRESTQEETPASSASTSLPPMFSGGSSAPLSPVGSPVTSSSSPGPSSSSGQTLSKPNDGAQQKQEAQVSQPQQPPAQQPQPQREPPPKRRSSRGF